MEPSFEYEMLLSGLVDNWKDQNGEDQQTTSVDFETLENVPCLEEVQGDYSIRR